MLACDDLDPRREIIGAWKEEHFRAMKAESRLLSTMGQIECLRPQTRAMRGWFSCGVEGVDWGLVFRACGDPEESDRLLDGTDGRCCIDGDELRFDRTDAPTRVKVVLDADPSQVCANPWESAGPTEPMATRDRGHVRLVFTPTEPPHAGDSLRSDIPDGSGDAFAKEIIVACARGVDPEWPRVERRQFIEGCRRGAAYVLGGIANMDPDTLGTGRVDAELSRMSESWWRKRRNDFQAIDAVPLCDGPQL